MTLQEICAELPEYQERVDQEQVIGRFKEHENFNPSRTFKLGTYIKLFSRIYSLNLPLEMMAKEHPEMQLHSGVPNSRRGSYMFYYDKCGNLMARLRRSAPESKKPIYCGTLVKVNGIPVIFDVVIAKAVEDAESKTKSILEVMEKDACRRRLYPVEECFGQEIRLVLVVPKDEYTKLEEQDYPEYEAFKERGGIAVPFNYKRNDFINEVRAVIRERGFKLR